MLLRLAVVVTVPSPRLIIHGYHITSTSGSAKTPSLVLVRSLALAHYHHLM